MSDTLSTRYAESSALCGRILAEVEKAIKGKADISRLLLCAVLARGHILIEDIPGVGKTTMALAFSRAMQLRYNRIQCTPDLMPSDITGFYMYRKGTERFELVEGAAMCNLLLADEINRTSTRTQSALLEVMEEGRVTVEMKSFDAPKPFTVIATQNPTGYSGTQLLPESQLDRFMMRLKMDYPSIADEIDIIKLKSLSNYGDASIDSLGVCAVASAEDIIRMQSDAQTVYVADSLYSYIVELVSATRSHPSVELGASPRAGIALIRCAKAYALMLGRGYVIPDDIFAVYYPTMQHRLIIKNSSLSLGVTARDVLEEILKQTPRPRIADAR